MPYSLMHNGVMREFDFYAPPGWEYWVGKAWEQRRVGLPLVIALHGGAEDPLKFQEDWFFPRVWNLGVDSRGNPAIPCRLAIRESSIISASCSTPMGWAG